MYIYERKAWPNFIWDAERVYPLLTKVRFQQGRLLGAMNELSCDLRKEANLTTVTQDIIKTSEIEGEKLDALQVRSSVARRLGIDIGATLPIDCNVEGIVEMMLDATHHYDKPLTEARLFAWHAALFPTGRSGLHPIQVGKYRNKESGGVQVVSGPIGREKVRFEAPSYKRLKKEMKHFIKWFNSTTEEDFIIKSALAHFWFVTIHPFDDGNGRIARAIADILLARSENSAQRFYSMSAQIQLERKTYYNTLEFCQKGSVEITDWVEWFLLCLQRAIQASDKALKIVLIKANFWRTYAAHSLNERQCSILNRLLDGFTGKLTTSKWAKLTKCSQDTALRDINDLLERGILKKETAGGRSTSYLLDL